MARLLEECVARAEAVVLRDVGAPVEGVAELLERGLREGCPPLSSACHTAVQAYRECVVEWCAEACRRSHCVDGPHIRLCRRSYWTCLARCTADHSAPEASSNIASWILAGLV